MDQAIAGIGYHVPYNLLPMNYYILVLIENLFKINHLMFLTTIYV